MACWKWLQADDDSSRAWAVTWRICCLQVGDLIESAKVVDGASFLQSPSNN
jgi:hypothetical protein